jgi:hypothetical protein
VKVRRHTLLLVIINLSASEQAKGAALTAHDSRNTLHRSRNLRLPDHFPPPAVLADGSKNGLSACGVIRNICLFVEPSITLKSRKAELRQLENMLSLGRRVVDLLLCYSVIVDNSRSRGPVDTEVPVLSVLNVIVEKLQDTRWVSVRIVCDAMSRREEVL